MNTLATRADQPRGVGIGASLAVKRRVGGGRLAAVASGLAYLTFAVYLTWPLALHLGSMVYGGGGDTWGSLAYWRELTDGGINPFTSGTIADLSAPGGLAVQYPLNIATWPSTSVLYGLVWTLGPTAGANVFVLSGYVLSGLAMYALVVRLVDDRGIAFVCGWAFAFCPYAVAKGAGHWHFVHTWPLVLIAWRMLVLIERPSLRTGLLTGIAVAFAISWTPYYVLFGAVMLLALVPAGAVIAHRRGELRPYLSGAAGALLIVGLTVLTYKLIATTTSNTGERTNTLAQIWYADPLQYLIPHPDNVFFGDMAREARLERWGNAGEGDVYLGWSVIALAIVGFVATLRNRTGGAGRGFLLALGAVILAALAFSTPPFIVDSQLKMPVAYLYDVTTAWRVVIRLAVVIMMCLCVFAAVGLAVTLANRRAWVRAGALITVFVVVALDLSARSPHPANRVPEPAVYQALRDAPPGLVVEYPIQSAEVPEYSAMLYQDLHAKPILNGFSAGGAAERAALELADLTSPAIPPRLALRGVRYVVVDEGQAIAGKPFPPGGVAGLRRLARGDGRSIYEVSARPAPAVWTPGIEIHGPDPVRWMGTERATLNLLASCDRCSGRVTLRLTSFARERRARVIAAGSVADVVVPVGAERQVALDVSFNRSLRVEITAQPGVQSIGEALGTADPRHAGVGIVGATFTLKGRLKPSAVL